MARPNAGRGLLMPEVSRSHPRTLSVGLLWMSDQLVAEAYVAIIMNEK